MKDQVYIYNINQEDLFTEEEKTVHSILSYLRKEVQAIKEYELINHLALEKYTFSDISDLKVQMQQSSFIKKFVKATVASNTAVMASSEFKDRLAKNTTYNALTAEIKIANQCLSNLMCVNPDIIRELTPSALCDYNRISIFASSFTRTLGLKANQTSTDIFTFQVKNYSVSEQLMNNGFTFHGEHYRFYTASAGAIREEKLTFMNSRVYDEYSDTLLCGLGIDSINKAGGMNITKFLAYSALEFSASDPWEVDLDRTIVIEDFETEVTGWVDHIDSNDFKITKQLKAVKVPHSDGAGMVSPELSTLNFQFRMPWFKGLLGVLDFKAFARENNVTEIKDIWGKTYQIQDIDIIFSRSQFKMAKFYSSWDDYKTNFKANDCHASKCGIEDLHPRTASMNYQMLQTLIAMTDVEIEALTTPTRTLLRDAYTDRDTMLRVLGATAENAHKNPIQRALYLYPEMISDPSVKDLLSDRLESIRKQAKYGKIKVKGSCNTFVLPDMLAWMQFAILGDKNPQGALKGDEVSCKLYRNQTLLVDRSPHLYLEHQVVQNVINHDTKKYFKTTAIHTSCHSLISKVLCFDCDGDHLLINSDMNLISAATRSMKGILPLDYEMSSAKSQIIDSNSIWTSLKLAFKYGNIGKYSNSISKLLSSQNKADYDIELVAILCFLNNQSIDSAKAGKMIPIPTPIKDRLKAIDKLPLPYFFKYAADKDKVAPLTDSTMSRITSMIESIPIPRRYKFEGLGKFDYKMLMNDQKATVTMPEVVELYNRLNKEKDFKFSMNHNQSKELLSATIYNEMRSAMVEAFPDFSLPEIVDQILKDSYTNHKTQKRTALFACYGDIIIDNLKANIKKPLNDGYFLCKSCGKRLKRTSPNQLQCKPCSIVANKLKAKVARSLKKTAV